ncbi:DinB family protein [Ascidiaceihabitans sp.]|uniref:DinB family protein n=2 Tax=Ascidiaceihabitans sp. TaxID=1872644 RepID=UPI0032989D39
MIDPAYVQLMSRYNAWQNSQLSSTLDAMTTDELMLDRGAFFGSILGTLNHLMWGDMLWMNRFDPALPAPFGGVDDSKTLHPTLAAWSAERFRLDGRLTLWASKLKSVDLHGDLTMFSRVLGQEVSKSMGECVVHFFNHQTHHRGQVHAMLTAAGYNAPVSDLFFLPKD